MFNIGEFARLGGVTVRTVRYYDQIGLLTAARVDADSGYRRYRASQLVDLQRIVALKDLGVTLDEIAELLAHASIEQITDVLRNRRAVLEAELQATHDRLAEIDRRLRRIERTGAMPDYEITVRSLPELRFVAVTVPTPGVGAKVAGPALESAFATLLEEVDRQAIGVDANAFVALDPEPVGDELTAYASLPVDASVTAVEAPLALFQLAPVEHAVSVTRSVPDTSLYSEIYAELALWMEENGWEHVGNGRDVIVEVIDGRPTSWETQWPMRRPAQPAPPVAVDRV